jgi:hypothetical protein
MCATVSQKLIHDRLNHGQCIYCGIQTHTVATKGFFCRSVEKQPITIPGKVDHGRCMNMKCQDSSTNIAATAVPNDEKEKTPGFLSGKTVGTVVSATGAVLSAIGVPIVGEGLSAAGQVIQSSTTSNAENQNDTPLIQQSQYQYDPFNPNYAQTMQESQQIDTYLQQLQITANQNKQQAYAELDQHIARMMQQSGLQSGTANQTCQQGLQRHHQHTRSDVAIMCPSNHQTQRVHHPIDHTCDICKKCVPAGTSVSWCSTCDWDACSMCK